MKVDYSKYAKFLIIYLYGVFILNIVSIFYMDRANNSFGILGDNGLANIYSTFFCNPHSASTISKLGIL